jgi:hypothetical protein
VDELEEAVSDDQLKVGGLSAKDADEDDAIAESRRKAWEADQTKTAEVKPNNEPCPGPLGNTCGRIYPQTESAPRGAPTDPPDKETEPKKEEKNLLEKFKEGVDNFIDKQVEDSGYSTPAMVAGAIAKGANELLMPTAAWELIPVGKVGKILKKGAEAVGIIKKGEKTLDAAKDAEKAKDVKKAEEAPPAESGGGGKRNDGGYVKGGRMDPHEVPCFKKGKRNKATDKEYEDQLADQEKALNEMSIKDYQKARDSYKASGRNPEAAAETRNFRDNFQKEQQGKLLDQKRADGMPPAKAEAEASKEASDMMKGLDALHTPDLSAGGNSTPTPTDMGSSSANRSIGGQWPQNGRTTGLDEAAAEGAEKHGKNAKMNVKLKRCK